LVVSASAWDASPNRFQVAGLVQVRDSMVKMYTWSAAATNAKRREARIMC